MQNLGVNRDGEFTPERVVAELGDDFGEVVRFLRNTNYIETSRYRAQQYAANRNGADPDLLEWERAVVTRFRKLGIPVYARVFVVDEEYHALRRARDETKADYGDDPHHYGCAVEIVHGTRQTDLPQRCWEVFHHVGHGVAEAQGLDLEWGGHTYAPERWTLKNWRDRIREREAHASSAPAFPNDG